MQSFRALCGVAALLLAVLALTTPTVRGGCVVGEPQPADLEVCSEHAAATCCSPQNGLDLQLDQTTECDPATSGACYDYRQLWACRLCSPIYGDFNNKWLCSDFAANWFEACKDTSFSIDGQCTILGDYFTDYDAYWTSQGYTVFDIQDPEIEFGYNCWSVYPLPATSAGLLGGGGSSIVPILAGIGGVVIVAVIVIVVVKKRKAVSGGGRSHPDMGVYGNGPSAGGGDGGYDDGFAPATSFGASAEPYEHYEAPAPATAAQAPYYVNENADRTARRAPPPRPSGGPPIRMAPAPPQRSAPMPPGGDDEEDFVF